MLVLTGVMLFITALMIYYAYWAQTIDPIDPLIAQWNFIQKNKKGKEWQEFEVSCRYSCDICRSAVDYNSKHCLNCNKCVADFDHHCEFLNNCIGSKNFQYFMKFVAIYNFHTALCIYIEACFIQ